MVYGLRVYGLRVYGLGFMVFGLGFRVVYPKPIDSYIEPPILVSRHAIFHARGSNGRSVRRRNPCNNTVRFH